MESFTVTHADASTQATIKEKIPTYLTHSSRSNSEQTYSLDTALQSSHSFICIGEDLPEMVMYAARSRTEVYNQAWMTSKEIKRKRIWKDVREKDHPAHIWLHFGPENIALNKDANHILQRQIRDLLVHQRARLGDYTFEAEEKHWPAILNSIGENVRHIYSCNFQDTYCHKYVFFSTRDQSSLECNCGKFGTNAPIGKEDKSAIYQTVCDYWFANVSQPTTAASSPPSDYIKTNVAQPTTVEITEVTDPGTSTTPAFPTD